MVIMWSCFYVILSESISWVQSFIFSSFVFCRCICSDHPRWGRRSTVERHLPVPAAGAEPRHPVHDLWRPEEAAEERSIPGGEWRSRDMREGPGENKHLKERSRNRAVFKSREFWVIGFIKNTVDWKWQYYVFIIHYSLIVTLLLMFTIISASARADIFECIFEFFGFCYAYANVDISEWKLKSTKNIKHKHKIKTKSKGQNMLNFLSTILIGYSALSDCIHRGIDWVFLHVLYFFRHWNNWNHLKSR